MYTEDPFISSADFQKKLVFTKHDFKNIEHKHVTTTLDLFKNKSKRYEGNNYKNEPDTKECKVLH